jgi:hypothetical protein
VFYQADIATRVTKQVEPVTLYGFFKNNFCCMQLISPQLPHVGSFPLKSRISCDDADTRVLMSHLWFRAKSDDRKTKSSDRCRYQILQKLTPD